MKWTKLSRNATPKVVYWHEELPPLDGEAIQENSIEAVSDRVPGSIERHGELWHRCYATLMEHTQLRLEQEINRLGGQYAHVIDEHVDSRRDDATGESWLHGRFSYVLYRLPETLGNITRTSVKRKFVDPFRRE
jgi:hypothetical protein